MRIAYGAGAVAVVSVIAVGLVQPDYAATADQSANGNSNVADANATNQADNSANNANQQNNNNGNNSQTQPDPNVRHVTKYIHLKPGQTAPPGATVIQPGQPTPRVVVANRPAPQPPANNPPPVANKPPANNPPPVVHNPPPPPPPAPKPPVKTHQSGHP